MILSSRSPSRILEDASGNYWIGSSKSQSVRLYDTKHNMVTTVKGLQMRLLCMDTWGVKAYGVCQSDLVTAVLQSTLNAFVANVNLILQSLNHSTQ